MAIDQIKAEVKQYLSCDVCGDVVTVIFDRLPISTTYLFEFAHCNHKTFKLTDTQMYELCVLQGIGVDSGDIRLNLSLVNKHLIAKDQEQLFDYIWQRAHCTLLTLCGPLRKAKPKVCSCGAVVTNPNAPLHSSWCDIL